MGYRDSWLRHEGNLTCHSEVVLHALDRAIPDKPVRLLVAGVQNGGTMQVWRSCLPEGSIVVGVDPDPRSAELGLDILVADPGDKPGIRSALRGCWFDIVIDTTSQMHSTLWPFIAPNGLMIYEGYDLPLMMDLLKAIGEDGESWLPVEEIMCVTWFPHIVVIEKRNPRVIPYLNIMVGSEAPIVAEETWARQRGAKRITLRPVDTGEEDNSSGKI